jgi:hypothetical protein
MIYPLRDFLPKLSSLRMLCATKISCFAKFSMRTKKLNLELENSFAEIASLWLMHNDMSVKPCENYKMIMVNYADLWIVHTQVASQL